MQPEPIRSAMPSEPDDEPVDAEALSHELARRIETLSGSPRRCPEPICRRRRTCAGRDMRCRRGRPPLELSPAERSRVLAKVQRMIRERLADLGAENG